MDEPSKNDHINEGILKQLTGGDPLAEHYIKMLLSLFNLKLLLLKSYAEIKSTDGGTWKE